MSNLENSYTIFALFDFEVLNFLLNVLNFIGFLKRSVNFEMSLWCLQILPTNERKQVDHIKYLVKSNIFVGLLQELRIPKSPFEIN